MRKLILIAHTSLDGFVADTKGALDGFDAGEENLRFVCSLTQDSDAALFGRISYELLNSYWPAAKDLHGASAGTIEYSNWYSSAEKIVISKKMANEHLKNITIISNDISNEIDKIKRRVGKNILIFGSPSVSQILMQHNLIDSYWIFINPIIFGAGIPLFPILNNKIKLNLISSKQFSNGEIALQYSAL